ncbi:putative zinc-binding peptidase [Rhodomicrobium vannielii ATCC 17100]|uniref:zinc-binding metallopeptidase family protein n=1 Tax=Rhodomicrobium vannielii TaxID=1069 RepID=UPI00191B8BB9|nr:putative zinc-binding peptidase [Rhodomicrobium vannielii]MBJ7533708.1 putative zinc-binding peptidase [Rhodomicrobium vannielii ATCC 17100]
MKLFECQHCGQLVYFENTVCERCGYALGFLPDVAQMTALRPNGDGTFTPLAEKSRTVSYCANFEHGTCNWLVDKPGELCRACVLNRTIPDLPENLRRWQRIEVAKHRLVYSLLRLGLPVEGKTEAPETGIAFDFLAPPPGEDGQGKILTGHDNGEITLNVIEAEDAVREKIRENMHEPYRTLLGHFRHEIAHYYFERLVKGQPGYAQFLATFGDETADYGEALKKHYANGAPPDWRDNHITSYASAHPHEDWAETFAHYLHMVDTLETAYAFGLHVRPRAGQDDSLAASVSFDPYTRKDFEAIIDAWLPVTFAVNSINRSMGIDDLYPFVISPAVIEKLRVVHAIVRSNGAKAASVKEAAERPSFVASRSA